MKLRKLTLGMGLVCLASGAANANITYYLDTAIGSDSAIGNIVTNGMLGSNVTGGIVGWTLSLTSSVAGSFILSSSSGNSTFQNQAGGIGGYFSATATQLSFDFSNGAGSYFQGVNGVGAQFVLCLQAQAYVCQGNVYTGIPPGPPGEGIEVNGPIPDSQISPMSGIQPIASAATLPATVTPSHVFGYDFPVVGGQTYFVDPQVATGYSFSTGAGDPNFASVVLPAVQSNAFDVSFTYDGMKYSDMVAPLTVFDFPAGGVNAFTVTGIDPADGLDPSDTSAFATGLAFEGNGTFTGTQTPITSGSAVPEASTWAMVLLGFAGLSFAGFRSRRTAISIT